MINILCIFNEIVEIALNKTFVILLEIVVTVPIYNYENSRAYYADLLLMFSLDIF